MNNNYIPVIESLIFSSDEPLPAIEIIEAIQEVDGKDISLNGNDVDYAVKILNEKYQDNDLAFSIVMLAGGYTFATRIDFSKYVGFLNLEKSKRRLTQAALETLAIIAYKQPITKPEIDAIRGVNSDYMINTLLEKNLINITGRADTIGRPLLYATTTEFLKYFGLNLINDLPKPREIDEIMKDEEFLEQKRKIMMNALEESITDEGDLFDGNDKTE